MNLFADIIVDPTKTIWKKNFRVVSLEISIRQMANVIRILAIK